MKWPRSKPSLMLKGNARRARGFTLLEILVAVSIFAVLAAMAYGGLNSIVRAQSSVRASQEALSQLDRALTRFEKDLRQALPRSVRGAYGTNEAALVGDRNGLSLSTLSISASENGPSVAPVRVRHSFVQGRWLRMQSSALDLAPNTPESARLVFEDLNNASLRYLDYQLREQDRWPPASAAQDNLAPDALPRAIELRFESKQFGEIRRLIAMSATPPSKDADE